MSDLRDDRPVRLTVPEMKALLRAGQETLEDRPAEWAARTLTTLARAVVELDNTLDFETRKDKT